MVEVLKAIDMVVGYKPGAPVAGPLNLTINRGDLVLLYGRNGSGKTTFLKTVAGLLKPLSGTISAPGAMLIPTRIPKVKGFTVTEFVNTGLSFSLSTGHSAPSSRKLGDRSSGTEQPVSRDGYSSRSLSVGETLELLGIAELADRDISTLSDGQFQKACLAPALASGKQLILLDEPTAFLDTESRENLMQLLSSFTNCAVIVSSHDIAACKPHCNRFISL
ncbi:MAG: ATP-binding cassette domain-containing protein [Bacteroidales bacterium]|nr:ATP-binding cassette domain-containing protein [Bacteroidales bacterium]